MRYFPLFADLRDRLCLVVGGGEVALRKVRLLLDAGARVRVVAPELHPVLRSWREAGRIEHLPERFTSLHLKGAQLAIAATGDPKVNRWVRTCGDHRRVLVNSVDDPASSSFIVPAIVDRSPLVVAISSGGAAPVLARRLRQWLETVLPQGLGALARLAGELREKVKRRLPPEARRGFWERQFTGRFARWPWQATSAQRARRCTSSSSTTPPDRGRPGESAWWAPARAIPACSRCAPCSASGKRMSCCTTGWSPRRFFPWRGATRNSCPWASTRAADARRNRSTS
jgi:uroporphyrin-III C-methyltransferase / precorrin-2 dehydrogenase / sirohydrochlorin ferrochelatase